MVECRGVKKASDNISPEESIAMTQTIPEFLSHTYSEVEPLTFYRELFPERELQERGIYGDGKFCGIAVQVKERDRAYRYSITDDLGVIERLIREDDFLIISPVSYCGKTQEQKNARFLYAVIFDLDGLIVEDGRLVGLESLISQIEVAKILPKPTYLVSSGTGIHVVYLLETPLSLYKGTLKQLRDLRYALTTKLWNTYTTTLSESIQYESCTQSFRAVGSICKDGVSRVRAFRFGDRVSVEYLNSFVPEKSRITEFSYKSKLSLQEAKRKYPEWYEKRIVNHQPAGTWTCKPDLYEWWLRQIKSGASVGHRYFCVMCLAVYARKSGISQEKLEKDALELVPFLDAMSVSPANKFDVSDVMAALEAYRADYITFPRDVIARLTDIEIEANKRNGRTLEKHQVYRRGLKELKRSLGELENDGRPSKIEEVRSFYLLHPDYSNTRIAKELGVSRPTVIKHLKGFRQE